MAKISKALLFVLPCIFFCSGILSAADKKLNVAVMDFSGKNVSAIDASVFSDILRTEIVNQNTVNVVDKANMDKILSEAAFQQSGCTSSECAAQVGKILNVQKMIVGSLSKIEGTYCANANYVDVETGKIERSETISCEKVKEFYPSANSLAKKLVGEGEDLRLLRKEKRPWFGVGLGNQYAAMIISPWKHFSFETRAGGAEGIILAGLRLNINYGNNSNKINYYNSFEFYRISFDGLDHMENGQEVYLRKYGQMAGFYFGAVYNFSKKFGFCIDCGPSVIGLGSGGNGGSTNSGNNVFTSSDISVNSVQIIVNMGIRYMF